MTDLEGAGVKRAAKQTNYKAVVTKRWSFSEGKTYLYC